MVPFKHFNGDRPAIMSPQDIGGSSRSSVHRIKLSLSGQGPVDPTKCTFLCRLIKPHGHKDPREYLPTR